MGKSRKGRGGGQFSKLLRNGGPQIDGYTQTHLFYSPNPPTNQDIAERHLGHDLFAPVAVRPVGRPLFNVPIGLVWEVVAQPGKFQRSCIFFARVQWAWQRVALDGNMPAKTGKEHIICLSPFSFRR